MGAPRSRARLDALVERAKALGAAGLAWFRVTETDGKLELDSPLDRFLSEGERAGVFAATGRPPATCW